MDRDLDQTTVYCLHRRPCQALLLSSLMPRTDSHKDERVMRSRWDRFHPPPVLLSFSRVTKEPSLEAQKRKRKKQRNWRKKKKKKKQEEKEKKPNCYRPGGQQHLGLKGQGSLVHLASSIRQKQTSTARAGGSKKDRGKTGILFLLSPFHLLLDFFFPPSLFSPPHLGF